MPTHKRDHEDANDNHVKKRAREDDCKQEILNLQQQLAFVTEERDKLKEDYKQEILNLQQQLTQQRDKLKMNQTQQAALNSKLIGQISELHKVALAMQEIPQSLGESIVNCKDIQVEKSSDDLDDPIAKTLCQKRFVLAKRTVNLSELQSELMVEIARRLKRIEDFTCLRSVSRSFYLLVKDEYFEGLRFRKSLPYLMLPPVSTRDGNDNIRQFYSLVEGESIVASLEVPAFKTITKMCFESLGWLLTIEVDGSICLLDPISGTEIPVPHLHIFQGHEQNNWGKQFLVSKMVLSSRPNETSDFILMVIIGNHNDLAFWRLGEKTWNKIDSLRGDFCDVVYGGGEQFYAINKLGIIWVINIDHPECRTMLHCESILAVRLGQQGQYIVKSIDGGLLGIKRTRDKKFYLTNEFQVYDIDIEAGEWNEIYSLGRMAVFLGRNSSFAVDATATASNGGGVIKPNHIYFTDDFGDYQFIYFKFQGGDNWRAYSLGSRFAKGGSVDCGAFNFETGDIEPIYPVEPLVSNVCPAMWITPNLCP